MAEVGDCVAASQDVSGQGVTEAEAKVVDCGSAEAATGEFLLCLRSRA